MLLLSHHEAARIVGKTIADQLREEGYQKGVAQGEALVRALQDEPMGLSALIELSRQAEQRESPPEGLEPDAHPQGRRSVAQEFRGPASRRAFKKGLARGAERGVTEGVITGSVELSLRLLRKRFGRIPPTAEERIRAADLYTLDRWAERLLTASTIEQVSA